MVTGTSNGNIYESGIIHINSTDSSEPTIEDNVFNSGYDFILTLTDPFVTNCKFNYISSSLTLISPIYNGLTIPSYKKYVALLNQTAMNDPAPTVLENTIGAIVWTRGSTGLYQATLSGAFTVGKTVVFLTNGATNPIVGLIGQANASANSISVITFDITAGHNFAGTDALLVNTPIEIRVYN